MKTFPYQQRVITVPRGQNVGQTIINDLKQSNLLDKVKILTINPQRDTINRTIVVAIEFTHIMFNT